MTIKEFLKNELNKMYSWGLEHLEDYRDSLAIFLQENILNGMASYETTGWRKDGILGISLKKAVSYKRLKNSIHIIF